jgi:hypothetical protein
MPPFLSLFPFFWLIVLAAAQGRLSMAQVVSTCGSHWWQIVNKQPKDLRAWLLLGSQSIVDLKDFDGDGIDDVWTVRNESPVAACKTQPLACGPEFRVVDVIVKELTTGHILFKTNYCGGIIVRAGWGKSEDDDRAVLVIWERYFSGQRVVRTFTRTSGWKRPGTAILKNKTQIASVGCVGGRYGSPTISGSTPAAKSYGCAYARPVPVQSAPDRRVWN